MPAYKLTCTHCNEEFYGRADGMYCSGACKVAAHRQAKKQIEQREHNFNALDMKAEELNRSHTLSHFLKLNDGKAITLTITSPWDDFELIIEPSRGVTGPINVRAFINGSPSYQADMNGDIGHAEVMAICCKAAGVAVTAKNWEALSREV